jgi:hypothetical protein
MLDERVRGMRTVALAVIAMVTACGSTTEGPPPSALRTYIDDPSVGRRALEESLVRKDNAYAMLRLTRYDTQHWGALPEHNPTDGADQGRP